MPVGTEFSRAVPHIWHKKFVELPLNSDAGGGVVWSGVMGTQNIGTVRGLLFKPSAVKNWTCWAMQIPGDWDGTSSFAFRFGWVQWPAGDQSTVPFYWTLHHWVCEDWDNAVGSKGVTQHATYTLGDEGTTNNCMHCGTFEMDMTGGTFGTVTTGNTLFMTFQMPQSVSGAGTGLVFRANVEYMARVTGPGDTVYTTQDKRGG